MNTTDNRGVDVRRLALIALMAAVICVLSPLAIPLSAGVPISLATLAVMLAGAVLGPVDGMLATLVFLALGMVGVPVFSSYQAGIGVLFGKTGGFILGYIPLALCSGLFLGKQPLSRKPSFRELLPAIGGMVLGTVIRLRPALPAGRRAQNGRRLCVGTGPADRTAEAGTREGRCLTAAQTQKHPKRPSSPTGNGGLLTAVQSSSL